MLGSTNIRGVKRLADPVSDLPCPSRTAVSAPVFGSLTRINPTHFVASQRLHPGCRGLEHSDKEDQGIAEACNRLIKNCIICWNYLYLARQIEKAGDEEARERLRRVIAAHSPMSWAHVNMLGEYDFSDEKLKDSIGILPLKPAASGNAQIGRPKVR